MQVKHDIEELVNRVKQKDLLAMRILYGMYVGSLMNLSLRITNNKAESEDILQESFLRCFQQIGKLKESSRFGGWLKRIVVNLSIQSTRGRRNYESLEGVSEATEEEDDHWYRNISFQKINEAIQELPTGCREIFTLYLLEGYKHKEVADLLEISVSNSKSQYRYALKLMKQKLLVYKT